MKEQPTAHDKHPQPIQWQAHSL